MIVKFGYNDPPFRKAEEVIESLSNHTRADGTVFVQEWPDGDICKDSSDYNLLYRFRLDLTEGTAEAAITEYQRLYATFSDIAKKQHANEPLNNTEKHVFEKWLASADTSAFDETLLDIYETMRSLKIEQKHIAERINIGESPDELDQSWLEYLQKQLENVTEEERGAAEKEFENYRQFLFENACARLGGGLWQHWHENDEQGEEPLCTAYQMHIRARRVTRLLKLEAPAVILQSETEIFAAMLFLHRAMIACSSMELE